MHIPLRKSFGLIRFLNRSHGSFSRFIFGSFGGFIALFATGSPKLSSEIWRRYYVEDDFKNASRRLAWYARKSWLRLNVSNDGVFDFTSGLNQEGITALKQFLNSSFYFEGDTAKRLSDLAFVAAYEMEFSAGDEQFANAVQEFNSISNSILSEIFSRPKSTQAPEVSKERVGDFPIQDATAAFEAFCSLGKQLGLEWFVISGTFLGLIREKGFLRHDYDIDLGAFEEKLDLAKLMLAIEQRPDLVVKKLDSHVSRLLDPPLNTRNDPAPYIIKIDHISGVHIDLFVHYREVINGEQIIWHGTSLHKWHNHAFDLSKYEFLGRTVLGPSDFNRYLTENYGDWQTPVTEFNCTTDTPNLGIVMHPSSISIFLARMVKASQSNHAEMDKLFKVFEANGLVKKSADQLCFKFF